MSAQQFPSASRPARALVHLQALQCWWQHVSSKACRESQACQPSLLVCNVCLDCAGRKLSCQLNNPQQRMRGCEPELQAYRGGTIACSLSSTWLESIDVEAGLNRQCLSLSSHTHVNHSKEPVACKACGLRRSIRLGRTSIEVTSPDTAKQPNKRPSPFHPAWTGGN